MPDRLTQAMESAAAEVRAWPHKSIQLFHHNDTDGLTSGAILTRAFERAGFAVRRCCLEKPYPRVLEMIFQAHGRLIVFTDFAGRIAPLISELNRGRNLVLILDHHKAHPATDAMVHNLDPELFGLTGDRDITASTTCYLFARALDPVNADLAALAAIGAVGDGFLVNGCLAGQNREAALEAARQGALEIETHATGETYIARGRPGAMPCPEFSAYLDTLGAAGYFQNGPEMGIHVCLNGIGPESDRLTKELNRIKTRAFGKEIQRLKNGELKQTDHIQWFQVEDRFVPMGVKMIGAFCERYRNSAPFDPRRFTAGFQLVPNEVPQFGPVPINQVKVSMRVSDFLSEEIRSQRAPGLDTFLPEATARLGGFSDGCHSLAAATTVAVGKEEALIVEMDEILHKHFK